MRREDEARRLRRKWQQDWSRHSSDELIWRATVPPPELCDLIKERMVGRDSALDMGCGDGRLTSYLAQYFESAVGLDVAEEAIVRASAVAYPDGASATFVVGDALSTPFRSGSFDFIFDRGCLQNLPTSEWLSYFQEIARLLIPGGYLQLFCSRPQRRYPPLFSRIGVKARVRALFGSRPKALMFLSHDFIEQLLPPSFNVVEGAEIPFRLGLKLERIWIYGLYRLGSTSSGSDPQAGRPGEE